MLAITIITSYSLMDPNLRSFYVFHSIKIPRVGKSKFKTDVDVLYVFKIIHYIKGH